MGGARSSQVGRVVDSVWCESAPPSGPARACDCADDDSVVRQAWALSGDSYCSTALMYLVTHSSTTLPLTLSLRHDSKNENDLGKGNVLKSRYFTPCFTP